MNNSLETPMVTAEKIAERGINLIVGGQVRNHKLRNSAPIHTGEPERRESRIYRDFLPSKNAYMIYNLTGSEEYEQY